MGAHFTLLHDAPAPAPAPTPTELAADFDTGGRCGAQKPPTMYITEPEVEPVPKPTPAPAPALDPAPDVILDTLSDFAPLLRRAVVR